MNVSAEVQKIILIIHMNGFETTTKQRATSSKLIVNGLNIGIEKNLHENGYTGAAILAKQKMVMIGHEAIGNHRNRALV